MFDYERLEQMIARMSGSREPELVLLNGHLLIERMLTEIVAVRLWCGDQQVPRLGFRALVQLAFSNDTDAKPAIWLNDLRNALAHEFDALNSQKFGATVKLFRYVWPEGALDRATVIQLIVYEVEALLFRQMARLIEAIGNEPYLEEWDEEQHNDLKESAETTDATVRVARELIDRGHWDAVVDVMKPGWRRPK